MILTNIFPGDKVPCSCVGRSTKDEPNSINYSNQPANKRIIRLNQQHANNCLIIKATADLASTSIKEPADAVLSDRTDIVLTVRTADCLPILVYHPSGIIGAIHAGRKGTDLGILKKALSSLKAIWGVEKEVKLWFGPAICTDCYQVSRDTDLRYDLRAKNIRQAESVFDAKSIQIIDSEYCTFHDNQHWYSYRREGAGVPMNESAIWLEKK